jgi:hypothetical protein
MRDIDGNGTKTSPYQITNVNQLQRISEDRGACYVLQNDIDATETKYWNDGAGFEPIKKFGGRFDGNGYEIKNLQIDRPEESSVGLFKSTHADGEQRTLIKNVAFTNSFVRGDIGASIVLGKDPIYSEMRNILAHGTVISESFVPSVFCAGEYLFLENCTSVVNCVSNAEDINLEPTNYQDLDYARNVLSFNRIFESMNERIKSKGIELKDRGSLFGMDEEVVLLQQNVEHGKTNNALSVRMGRKEYTFSTDAT